MKKIKCLFCGVFLLIIYVFSFMTLTANKAISKLEGRLLTKFPEVSVKGILQAEFRKQIEEAFSDQIPYRNELVRLYFLFQFQRYYGDVAIGKDGQLFASILTVGESYFKRFEEVVEAIDKVGSEITDLDVEFILLSMPRKDAVMKDYLPSTYISSEEIYLKQLAIIKERLNKKIRIIDPYEVFSGGNYYFVTDHHLNIRGSDLLFQQIVSIIQEKHPDFTVASLDDYYDITSVVINGSFNRQIGQKLTPEPEELFIKPKVMNFSYTRKDNGKDSTVPVWGNSDFSYATAYMNGDYGETVVETNRDWLPNILYVGSSYVNSLESLSVPWFNKMVSIDYRHNTSGLSIKDYVLLYDIDYVVFCPSQSTNAFPIDSVYNHLGLK